MQALKYSITNTKSQEGEEPAGDVPDDPVDALEQPLPGAGAAADDAPVAGADALQLQVLPDLLAGEAALNVLLVAEDEQRGAHQPLLAQEAVQFGLGVLQAHFVGAVDHPDHPVGLLEVVAPVGADGLLAADVPDVELEGLVLEGLDVEAERGGDLVDVLAVELLDDGGLAGVVEAQHQQPHLLLLLLCLLDDGHEPHLLQIVQICPSVYLLLKNNLSHRPTLPWLIIPIQGLIICSCQGASRFIIQPILSNMQALDQRIYKMLNQDTQSKEEGAADPSKFSSAFLAHVLFKTIAIALMWLRGLLMPLLGKIIVIELVLLFVVLDFWLTKNVNGKSMLGLRWAFEEDENGDEKFQYEGRVNEQYVSGTNSKLFWVVQFLYTVVPIIFLVFAVFSSFGIALKIDEILLYAAIFIGGGVNLFFFWRANQGIKSRRELMKGKLGNEFVNQMGAATVLAYVV